MIPQDNIIGSEGAKKKHLEDKKTKHMGVGHILQSSQAIKKALYLLIDRVEKHEEMLLTVLQRI